MTEHRRLDIQGLRAVAVLVVLPGLSTPWTPPDRAATGTQESGGLGPHGDDLASAITSRVEWLQRAGHQVTLLQLLPHFSRDPHRLAYERCSTWAIIAGGCTQRMPREFADDMQADMLAGFSTAATLTGVPIIDLRDRLCPEGICTTELDGEPVYLDGGHISVGLSKSLASDLVAHLEAG